MTHRSGPTLPELFLASAKIGAFTIGGGYAMVPVIRAELVEHRHWLSDEEFVEAFGLSQTVPGAIAVNTSVFTGYNLRGFAGALAACLGTILPSFVIILIVAAFFGQIRDTPVAEKVFHGIRPAIVGLIAVAAVSLSRTMLRDYRQWSLALALLLIVFLLDPHPLLVIALAILIGFLLLKADPGAAPGRAERGYIVPGVIFGLAASFFIVGAFTFGGGYAMIPLIQRIIITEHHWLTTPQFLDILAIAGMTPGPISINAATFVGYRVGGVIGSAAATFGVVLPSIIIVLSLARVFRRYRDLALVQRMLAGLRVAVIALIAAAVVTVGQASILTWQDAAVAGAVTALLLTVKVHPAFVLLGAGVAGVFLY